MPSNDYRDEFLRTGIELGALRFGSFTLKSGRISPYFFNAGLFNTGSALAMLGRCYADALVSSGVAFDMLFGPAYKGIPLVAVTAAALAERHGIDVPYAFNRKEVKDHGEGGVIVGAPLAGRVITVDDVITAGTAIREAMSYIHDAGAEAAGVLIALDRQERGKGVESAIQEVERLFSLKVVCLATLSDLIDYLQRQGPDSGGEAIDLDALARYREQYSVTS